MLERNKTWKTWIRRQTSSSAGVLGTALHCHTRLNTGTSPFAQLLISALQCSSIPCLPSSPPRSAPRLRAAMQQRGKAPLPLHPSMRQRRASPARLLASHLFYLPKPSASQPENQHPLPSLPEESCFMCPEEDFAGQGLQQNCTTSVPPQLQKRPSRCEAWRAQRLSYTRRTEPSLLHPASGSSFTAGLYLQLPPVLETPHAHTAPGSCCHRTCRAPNATQRMLQVG